MYLLVLLNAYANLLTDASRLILTIVELDTHFKYNERWKPIEATDIPKVKKIFNDLSSSKPAIKAIILHSTLSSSAFEQVCRTNMFNTTTYHGSIAISIYQCTYYINLETFLYTT